MREIRRQQRSFADLELWRQGVRLDPVLEAISRFLDDHSVVLTLVHADLIRGQTPQARGRVGLSAEQVLRAVVLKQVKHWDYRELRDRIADGVTLRQFTRFEAAPVPKHDAFHRAFVALTPETLRTINEAVVAAAVALGLEDGRQLRVDTTVVETDIRYPRVTRTMQRRNLQPRRVLLAETGSRGWRLGDRTRKPGTAVPVQREGAADPPA